MKRAAAAHSSPSERLTTNALLTFQILTADFSPLTGFSPPALAESRGCSLSTGFINTALKKETFIYSYLALQPLSRRSEQPFCFSLNLK